MNRLPVIVGLGGVNPAGRVSFHHAYRRMVLDGLGTELQDRTYQSLATLMNLDGDPGQADTRRFIEDHTLVRRLEIIDPAAARWQNLMDLQPVAEGAIEFLLNRRQLPETPPAEWQITDAGERHVRVRITATTRVLVPELRASKVTSAGQLPTGFDPAALYQSRSHPRGLQLTIFGASDALRSTGLALETLKKFVAPDEFAVFSGSAMGQLDDNGYGGLLQSTVVGKRPTSKQIALALSEMPGDFINAYVLGSVGETAGIIGACATFLYNIHHAVEAIRTGRKRLVLVGNSEAPITHEIMEGYRTMGALAEDEALMALDGSATPDNRRACRPFSDNCGFTVAEAGVYTVLMDDELALELGARILGSVGEVFVNADGYKKSIPGPGIGNYLTMAKAMATARKLLGERGLRHGTHVQAHGTGTPQNRVTESHILNELAGTFGIKGWPVAAIKAYVGHSMAPAGGDQLLATLGTWEHHLLPGITTIDHIAEDVHQSNLVLPMKHLELAPEQCQAALINSKGFGGNNATGLFLSPELTRTMLEKRWGKARLTEHARRAEAVAGQAADYDAQMLAGTLPSIYQFGEGVLEGEDLTLSTDEIQVPGFGLPVSLDLPNPYPDMT